MTAPAQQQPVQALGSDRVYPPFRVGVGVGRLHRLDQYLGAVRTEELNQQLTIDWRTAQVEVGAGFERREDRLAGRVVRQDRGRLDMLAAVLGRLSPPGHREPAAGARRWRWIASNAS